MTTIAIVVLLLAGLGSLGAGVQADHPPMATLLVDGTVLPPGYVLNTARSGPINAARLNELGYGGTKVGGVTAYIRDWGGPSSSSEIRIIGADGGSPGAAAAGLRNAIQTAKNYGLTALPVHGIAGAAGAATADGRTAEVWFARGDLLFAVGVIHSAAADRSAQSIAIAQQEKVKSAYGGGVAKSADLADAAGGVLGGFLGYILILGAWAYYRDPLRRQGQSPAGPDSPAAVDVTAPARTLKHRAMIFFWVQVGAASLIVDAVLPFSLPTRVGLVLGGLFVLAAARFARSHDRGPRQRLFWTFGGTRPARATVLVGVGIIAALAGGLSIALDALTDQQTPGAKDYGAAGCLFLAAAALSQRRARRISAIDAQRVLSQDTRPMVLYLRSFGDDALRLRTATLGRRSLLERFSPSRFDSFEEVIVRHLSKLGPVVAINPPGTTLPPIGAARATMPQTAWQSRVFEWMDSAALIVVGAPPGVASPGLVWELQQINDRGHWARTLVVVPPVKAEQARWRFGAFAAAGPSRWPFRDRLPADPARVLVLSRLHDTWVACTADERTEWTYAAALQAALGLLPRNRYAGV